MDPKLNNNPRVAIIALGGYFFYYVDSMLLPKKFQKNKEDFVCEKCSTHNSGDGYTNHCQACLWSKHVDVNPGDRASDCGGMMRPKSLENKSDVFYIVHECVKCGHVKRNKAQKGDNFDELIKLSSLSSTNKIHQ
jgi:hypothetical protein